LVGHWGKAGKRCTETALIFDRALGEFQSDREDIITQNRLRAVQSLVNVT